MSTRACSSRMREAGRCANSPGRGSPLGRRSKRDAGYRPMIGGRHDDSISVDVQAMWRDERWKAMPVAAQWLYIRMAAHPTRVFDAEEVAALAVDLTPEAVEVAAAQLIGHGAMRIEAGVCVLLRGDLIRQRCHFSPHRRHIPIATRRAVLERCGHACVHCGTTDDLHMDHIYPHVLGGSDDEDNLQALCRRCNLKKGARVDG